MSGHSCIRTVACRSAHGNAKTREKPMLRGERTECLRISCRACYGLGLMGSRRAPASSGKRRNDRAGVHPSWHGLIEARGDARRSKIHIQCPLGYS